ncbi:3-oxoacyl-ACP synthase [Spirochaetia bacterium]|nr:3-oxoacyl-ACP synthase [Spirochaetia bacterium]
MAFLKAEGIKVCGVSACVPTQIDENCLSPLFDKETLKHVINTTGIKQKRKTSYDVCTSDLCIHAAEKIISDLAWGKEDISLLVFVSHTMDYILPPTSPIIQNKLGLSTNCYTIDISLGCSGWVYGMSVAASLLKLIPSQKGRALLLVGDTLSKIVSNGDKSTYPLFGDAGTATALELMADAEPMLFDMNSDGDGYKAIIINDGGSRNPVSESSFNNITRGEGIISNNTQLVLNGMDVFSFGIKRAPESINKLIDNFHLNKDQIDYFLFHQANFFMNEQIRKKLKIPIEKVPYSFSDFGNTSGATIPLTMVTQLNDILREKKLNHIACGFGVGLSWGSMYFSTDKISCCPLIEV